MGSHLPVLREAVMRTAGPVIEIGAGRHSTPMLLELCSKAGRMLVTVEHEPTWMPVGSDRHLVVTSLLEGIDAFTQFGVALVDGTAVERGAAILLLLPKCDFIVVHDTEVSEQYLGMETALMDARYRWDDKSRTPWTTVVSDVMPWT